jgi:hypothetical protein
MRTCIYCGKDKADNEFSREHIWPDALGGDFLPPLFQTDDVCERCNSVAGRYVDGAFLKSWFGQAERSASGFEYLELGHNSLSVTPLHYMGVIADAGQETDDVYEMWVGPCGTHVIHAHAKDDNTAWETYAGGDPVARKRLPGRVYVSLTSTNPLWIGLALRSVKAQFKKAARYIVNAKLPAEWSTLASAIDPNDADQSKDLKVVDHVRNASRDGNFVKHNVKIQIDPDHRFLPKVGLGLGYQLFGPRFIQTPYAAVLRQAMREPSPQAREQYPIYGTGFFNMAAPKMKVVSFPGAWVLFLKAMAGKFGLMIITPSGKSMSIAVSDTPELWSGPEFEAYKQMGEFYVVVPPLGTAAGPISAANYLNHQLRHNSHPELAAIEARRTDKASLPPCR